jgi:uncharacterized protein
MNIDVDSHYNPPEMYYNIPPVYDDAPKLINGDLVIPNLKTEKYGFSPVNFDINKFINAMKEAGFDKQCLNIGLTNGVPYWWIKPETELYLTKAWNDHVAKVVAEHDCFIGVAQVTHRNPQDAINEAERAIKDLGFSAINVEGHWAGNNIASLEWWDFFAAVEKLGVPIFSHPSGRSSRDMFDLNIAGHEQIGKIITASAGLLAFLVQHEVAMTSVVLLGLLDRFPKLKFAWLETDVGWVPSFMEMIDAWYDAHKSEYNSDRFVRVRESQLETINLKKRPSQYFKENFYYSINFPTDLQLNYLLPIMIEKLNLGDKLLVQTDFDHSEGDLDVVRRIVQCKAISEEVKQKILGKNAATMLNIKWTPSAYEHVYA